MTERELRYKTRHHQTYDTYTYCRELIKGHVSNEYFAFLTLPSLNYDFGLFFYEALAVIIKHDDLDLLAPEQMRRILHWMRVSCLNIDGEIDGEISDVTKLYQKSTGEKCNSIFC
ncbi:hypothetical protein GCM10007377_02940 [Galliscardovia ingluviei]|uniref:Uncharacterized protein n=1 Tax=Galliscardovia ingluviei TaxID=1769422 RepID=A0A8J3AHB2_9BIFI|nr:hypothetical protein [Galliscardovia ingluviei]GGI12834.1 hypothetical protein GCM10007377_02940 [Galliscardovia ingluviei]